MEQLWADFCRNTGLDPATPYEAWAFGGAPDKLAQLVLAGVKTATASALELFEAESEPTPQVGDYSVILDAQGQALCVIRTTRVTVVPFPEVSALHAWLEGEGDRTLVYWREVHHEFFTNEYASINRPFREDMPVICEEFEMVYPAKPTTAAPVTLETDRLTIRPLEPPELRALIEAEPSAELREAYGEMLQAGLEHLSDWIWYTAWNLYRHTAPDTAIGNLGFKGAPLRGAVEIGYGMEPPYERQGYMTEAAAAAIAWAFAHGADAVEAETDPDNAASQRVLAKLGFVRSGYGAEGPRFVRTAEPLHIEAATSADIPQIVAMYRAVVGRQGCTWDEEYPSQMTADYDFSHGCLRVLRMGSRLIGAASVVAENELDELSCWQPAAAPREIGRVVIAPDAQGHGYAVPLLEAVFAELQAQSCDTIRLLAAKCNEAALHTYQRLGFRFVGECHMYGHDYFACEKVL